MKRSSLNDIFAARFTGDTLSDGRLLLDIATTFASGRVFSYTAKCEKEEASE